MYRYFNIRYEFDKNLVIKRIDDCVSNNQVEYVCVADGVILNTVYSDVEYRKILDNSLFSICDSSWVPLFINWIYGVKLEQYCGSKLFEEIIVSEKYRMIFLGSNKLILDNLKLHLSRLNHNISDMQFINLPYCNVEDFDYKSIAEIVNSDGSDIIWVALGAPKQEIFMNNLKPYLRHGVIIAVGAVFKFYSGMEEKRAPEWMVKYHLEFLFRIYQDPRKQIKRCVGIVFSLPMILFEEWKKSKSAHI